MKTIGLLGGMSWESTSSYYQLINTFVKQELGGLHSAKVCLYSVDFHEVEQLQHQGQWQVLGDRLAQGARRVEAGGADFLLICTNTMHKVVDQIERAISIPVLHIADATARELVKQDVVCVGLLGTRFTMEQDFYKERLRQQFGIEVVVPGTEYRQWVHDTLYQELCQGIIEPSARQKMLQVVERLQSAGAQAVILGCTELALLIQQQHTEATLLDTVEIHARDAVANALAEI